MPEPEQTEEHHTWIKYAGLLLPAVESRLTPYRTLHPDAQSNRVSQGEEGGYMVARVKLTQGLCETIPITMLTIPITVLTRVQVPT